MLSLEQQYQHLREERQRSRTLPPVKLPDGRVMTAPYAPMFYSIKKMLAEFSWWQEQNPNHPYNESYLVERLGNLEASGIRLGLIQGSLREVLEGK
jgi:hypothetical protein